MSKEVEKLMSQIGFPIKINYSEETKQFAIMSDREIDHNIDVFGSGETLKDALKDFLDSEKSLEPFLDRQEETMIRYLGDDLDDLEDDLDSIRDYEKRRKRGYF